MTQEEILEYNKMCAEFLGWKYSTESSIHFPKGTWVDNKSLGHCAEKGMAFHSDWNWIMEVVEKVQSLDRLGGIVLIQQGRCKITSRMAGDHSVYADVSNYFKQGMKGQKEAVVQAINEFLIWYKEQTL